MKIENGKIVDALNIVIGKLEPFAQANSEIAYCAGMLTAIGKVIEDVHIVKEEKKSGTEKLVVL